MFGGLRLQQLADRPFIRDNHPVQRRVDPEILDELPPEDPEAIRSRRDLRRLNALMGSHRWLARRIRELRQPSWRVLELGAGDGSLGTRLVRRNHLDPQLLGGLDLAPRPPAWPERATWTQGNVLATLWPPAEVIIANLFLHHFNTPELATIGNRITESCQVLLCSEPARRRLHLWQAQLPALIGLVGRVTKHDMPVSIRAGFLHDELPQFLGIQDWKISVSTTFFGAYRLVALRP